MNLLLMPMWLLSGSFFPASGAPPWIKALIVANPLTYGVAAFGIFSTSAVKSRGGYSSAGGMRCDQPPLCRGSLWRRDRGDRQAHQITHPSQWKPRYETGYLQ